MRSKKLSWLTLIVLLLVSSGCMQDWASLTGTGWTYGNPCDKPGTAVSLKVPTPQVSMVVGTNAIIAVESKDAKGAPIGCGWPDFSSSDTTIVSQIALGNFVARKEGAATIRIRYEALSDSAIVTVTAR